MKTRCISIGFVAGLVMVAGICGCTPGGNGGNGGGDPVPGGQGIAEGSYSGTLQCTETTSAVTEDEQESVLATSNPSFQVTYSFDESGIILDSHGDPVEAGTQEAATIGGATGVATVRSVTTAVDRLEVIADATATVTVTGRGQRVMLGVVTAVYEFAEPNTVTISSEKVFTSNLIEGEFIKIVAECTASLAYGG
jgi:hypothetical protein